MMINFLTAHNDTRLAKSYTPDNKQPYPHVGLFTSHSHEIDTIEDFYAHLVHYGDIGGCLLKGTLLRPLHNESRAGSTSADTPTFYAVIDADRCSLEITSPEEFINQCLPTYFHDADYIWQWSNSAGITKPGITGHFFFLLNHETNVKLLKKAFTQFNYLAPALESQIRLSHNGLTLTYGLDPTVAQNDKLIFIAPPTLQGIDDPHPTRTHLVKQTNRRVTLDLNSLNVAEIDTRAQRKIQELRQAAGLPRRDSKYKTEGTFEYLKNPEKAIFRGPYKEARGFRYGNLNNGDSYAYFHPLENPKFLYNFKGEPIVRLQDIDPDYWRQIQEEHQPEDPNKQYFAFRDQQSDQYYTVVYEKNRDRHHTFIVSNIQKALDFLKIHNQPIPETLPIWDVIFEPTKNYTIDVENQRINLFQKTEILRNAYPSTYYPKKFAELLLHVVGGDLVMRDDLLNWLAYIIQKRTKTQTAFILHGRTGTGKGVLFSKILQPILGILHCPMIMMDDIAHDFNEWVETGLLVVVDEAQISEDLKKAKKRINKIKNLITEQYVVLKKKYAQAHQIENHINFIFTSNEHDSIWINSEDRRFKVAPRQENYLNYSEKDIQEIENEVQDIANYLIGYPVNENRVRKVVHNEARSNLITASQSTLDEFISIIKNGDLEALIIYHDEFVNSRNAIYADKYKSLVNEWTLYSGQESQIAVSDLRIVYSYIFNTEIGASKFGRILSSKGIKCDVARLNGRPTRLITLTWKTANHPLSKDSSCHGVTVN